MRIPFSVTVLGILKSDTNKPILEREVARLLMLMERDYGRDIEAELNYMGYSVEDIFYSKETTQKIDGQKFYLNEQYEFYVQGVKANKKIVDRLRVIFAELEEGVNYSLWYKDALKREFKKDTLAIKITLEGCA